MLIRIKYSIIIFSVILLTGCSTRRIEYQALNTTFKDLKAPFTINSVDSFDLVDYSFKMNELILTGYLRQKETIAKQKIKSSGNFFEWTNKKYEWTLTEKTIEQMVESLKKQQKVFWDKEKIKNSEKSIKIVDYPIFNDLFAEDAERQKRIKTNMFIYFFSKPVFNKNRDIFMIQYEILLLPNSKSTLIYKKEKGIWIQIASLSADW